MVEAVGEGVVQLVPQERVRQQAVDPAGSHFGDDGFVYLVLGADPGRQGQRTAAHSAADWLGT